MSAEREETDALPDPDEEIREEQALEGDPTAEGADELPEEDETIPPDDVQDEPEPPVTQDELEDPAAETSDETDDDSEDDGPIADEDDEDLLPPDDESEDEPTEDETPAVAETDDIPEEAENDEPGPADDDPDDDLTAGPEDVEDDEEPTPDDDAADEDPSEPEHPEGAGEIGEPVPAPVGGVEDGEDEPAEEEPEPPNNKRWYAVKIQSGRETTIRAALERRVRIEGLEEYIGRILIPTERQTVLRKTKTKTKDGEEKIKEKRVTREVKKYPGYLFVEVEFNDQVLYLFRETTGVGDFVGGSFNRLPTPMNDREVQRMLAEAGILKKTGEEGKEPELVLDFQVGDRVKIRNGSFKDQEGEVKEILFAKDERETTKVRVELTIFGRPVPLEIEPWHVEVV